MTFSTFSRPAILNENYKPLQYENPTLKFYFKEVFVLLDDLKFEPNERMPNIVLTRLFDKYLRFNKLNRLAGRTIEQQTLVRDINPWLSASGEVDIAFRSLNQSGETIKPNDDLIWLLSAYCSVFPLTTQLLTNLHIKNALTLCDINEIYFRTVCIKGKNAVELKQCVELALPSEEKHEVILTQGADESSRKKLIENALAVLDTLANDKVDGSRVTLLAECVSQMTGQEMIDHKIVLKVGLLMHWRKVDSINTISDTLKLVFSRVENRWHNARFFKEYLSLYLEHELKDEKILLPILVSKVDSTTHAMACRFLLKSDFSRQPDSMQRIGFVLTLLYKRSKELYKDIAGFRAGEYHEPIPPNQRKSSVM